MKKRKLFYLMLVVAVLFSLVNIAASPAKAQEQTAAPSVTLDTTLAQAAAEGFLTALSRQDLTDMADFYLADGVEIGLPAADLASNTGYTITEAAWFDDDTYQVKATMQPGSQEINLNVQKINSRWQVVDIEWPLGPPTAVGPASATAAAAGGIRPVAGNGSGKIVFQTRSGGDIYIINADGTGLQWITTGIDPQLSPDGTQIVFTRWEPRYELFTINIDGTNERAWTHGWRQLKSPTWSADGSKIVFTFQDGGRLNSENVRINVQNAVQSGEDVGIPSDCTGFEQEGKYLKCTIPADTYWHLKQIDLNTGEMLDLGTENYTYGPSGHPQDANLLTYRGERGLALHDVAQNRSRPITSDHRDYTPAYTPDGSKIAVAYRQDGHWEIHTMFADGSNRQRLTSTPLSVLVENTLLEPEVIAGKERFAPGENPHWNNAAPVWSADGSQIAFLTDRADQWEIWIMNADGSNQRPMFPNGALSEIDLNYAGVDEHMLSWRP